MKAILNHKWKLLAAIVLVLALVVPMVSVVGAGAANGCTVTVHIPDEVKDVNGNSGYVTFYGDSAKYYDGQTKVVSAGKTVAWYIWVNGKRTPNPGNKQKIDCASDIYVTTAHYCVMEVQIPSNIKNLDESPAYVTIYGIKKNFSDGDKVVLPVCQTIAWYLHVNGKRTPNPGIYKHVDCSDLVVTDAHYCDVKNDTGQKIKIYKDIVLDVGDSVILPMGLTIDWIYDGGRFPGTNKNVDCTPIGDQSNGTPVADAGSDQTVEQTNHAGAEVTLDGSGSSDPDGDSLTYDWTWSGGSATGENPTVTLPSGATTITLTVSDDELSDTDEVVITVVDTTPPEITVSVSPDTLWPPNHKMVEITATVTVSDMCDLSPVITLTSIASNEPDDAKGNGDGNTENDIQGAEFGTKDYAFLLRAERAGNGDGRVYTITYTATDASGNRVIGTAIVIVPHDKGK